MWQGIHGHDDVVERFRTAAARGRVAGTYLFVGPEGIGKRSLALQFAKTILCQSAGDDHTFDACGSCQSCRLFDSGGHPDLERVAKHADRQNFTIDLLLGDRQHRNREGLLPRLSLKPTLASRKVAILDDADHFNPESANALLKMLEEPPPGAVIFLIGTSQNRQLPTIRSRSQIVRFQPLSEAVIAQLLLAQGVVEDAAKSAELAAVAGGSLSRAQALADDDLWQFRARLFDWLRADAVDGVRTSRAIAKFVDEAGREAKDRRLRLRKVIGFAVEHYHNEMRSGCVVGASDVPDDRVDASLFRLDRCLDALGHIDRNANLATLIDWWIGELAAA